MRYLLDYLGKFDLGEKWERNESAELFGILESLRRLKGSEEGCEEG